MLAFRGEGGLAVPGPALFLGAEPHPELCAWPEPPLGWQPLRAAAAAWDAAGLPRVEEAQGRFPLVMILPGKVREETLGWFGLARECLQPGGRIIVAMSNLTGAARFEKELKKACGKVESIQKNKCRVFTALDQGGWDEGLFAAWRLLAEPRPVAGLPMLAQAGLFSPDHPDPGSALLAANLPPGLRGRVADLGAGWGFLADAVLRRCPRVERVDLLEHDARALDCARRNLGAHGGRAAFLWHDVRSGAPGEYDAVVMNPPFHVGRETRPDVGIDFIAAAAGALRRGGGLHMVANRQLPYEGFLSAFGFTWHTAAEDAAYKLLFAVKSAARK